MKTIISLLLIVIFLPTNTFPCSSFLLEKGENQSFFVKGYDWIYDLGLVIVNKRNVSKKALLMDKAGTPATWVSKYGSVTFNQYGREFPIGGINEAGLTVETLVYNKTKQPSPDKTPTLNELQWVQYQLDNYSNIKKLVAAINNTRITKIYTGLHHLVCDKSGACASIEFINGKPEVAKGQKMPVKALTNSSYRDSKRFIEKLKGFGGSKDVPKGRRSLSRFSRAALACNEFSSSVKKGVRDDPVGYAFSILANKVNGSIFNPNQWRIVYDFRSGDVFFNTRTNRSVKKFDRSAFDYSCLTPVMILDMNQKKLTADVTQNFSPYSKVLNAKTVTASLKPFLKKLPKGTGEAVSAYPQTTRCLDKPVNK